MSTVTILAARRVVPPDLMAPAARSPIFRKLIKPDERPPPARRSLALRRAIDAVGPMQSGVEPLRRIGRCHLAAEHEAHLVEIGAGVILGIEIAALPAPVGPGPGEAVENLLGAALGPAALVRRELGERLLVRSVAPQPSRHIALHYRLQPGRNPRLAEILLREDVAGDLTPFHRHFHIAELEDDGAVRIA